MVGGVGGVGEFPVRRGPHGNQHPYYHQTSRIVGGVRSRFLILQYPHKIFAITVKVDGG